MYSAVFITAPGGAKRVKQTAVEADTVLEGKFSHILRQQCSQCVSITVLVSLSMKKFALLKLLRTVCILVAVQ